METKLEIQARLKIIISVLIFIFSLGLFSLIVHEVLLEKEDIFDNLVFTFFNAHSSPSLTNFFYFFTFFGSTYFLLPAYLILISIFLYKQKKSYAIDTAILGLTSTLLLFALKEIFARNRPSLPLFRELHTYSFPSGHSLLSFVFFSLLTWLVWQSTIARKWKLIISLFFLLFSLLIGISRIALRYHYASDVLAGLVLGLSYVLLFFGLQRIFNKPNQLAE